MKLDFDTKVIPAGNQSNGNNKMVSANRNGGPVSVSVLGLIQVSAQKGKEKATVYVGQNGGTFVLAKSTKGLTPFTSKDMLDTAVRKAIAHIKDLEKPFSYLAQLSN